MQQTAWRWLATGALVSAIFISGCSTGLHQDALNARLSSGYPEPPFPEAKAMAVPVKLAVSLQCERHRRRHGFAPDPRLAWSRADQEMLVAQLQDAMRLKALAHYTFLPPETAPDLDALAAAAQSDGAEALLVLRAVIDVDWYQNPATLLDPTLLGAIWFPASHRDVLVAMRADLFDLRGNRDLVWTGTDSDIRKIEGPTLVVDTRDAAAPARRSALRQVLKGLYNYLRRQTPPG